MNERIGVNQYDSEKGGAREMPPRPQPVEVNPESAGESEILVWQKSTWGSFGQHANIYTFVWVGEKWSPIFKLLPTRHENRDSRKNYHRYTYVKVEDLVKLENAVIKRVRDYASSSKRNIEVEYYRVKDGQLVPLKAETDLRDNQGFYNVVYLPEDLKIVDRKDKVEVMKDEVS
jgi:hypothetical protein